MNKQSPRQIGTREKAKIFSSLKTTEGPNNVKI